MRAASLHPDLSSSTKRIARLWAASLTGVLCSLTIMAAQAQTDPEAALRREMQERAAALADLEASIDTTQDEEQALAREVAALQKDRTTLDQELIITAQKARDLEQDILQAEAELDRFLETEEVIRLSLIKRRALLVEILATLQRMGRAPPPALLVQPEDVLSAVRSAILIGAVLPDVRDNAERLAQDLNELILVRSETEAATLLLREDYQALSEAQTRLTLLLDEKRGAVEASREALATQQQATAALAADADNLRGLIAGMERDIAAARQARQDAIAAAEEARRRAAERAAARTRDAKLQALEDQGRIAPAIPFAEALGLLPLPVVGGILTKYGAADANGDPAQGLSIAARPNSTVIAPADGWVVYAGPFGSYGQLLILNTGEEHHVVLAGMERIHVVIGQFVLSGEPVATMGGVRTASLANISASGAATLTEQQSLTDSNVTGRTPILYVEFRKDGQSIDPNPWWVVDG